jgi:hypothetical protein
MEWFSRVQPPLTLEELTMLCRLPNLPRQCASVHHIASISDDNQSASIECVWGVFDVSLTPIRNGFRYALTSCPNALQWTVTTCNGETLIHCSINQETVDPDFSASIREFIDSFRTGLGH